MDRSRQRQKWRLSALRSLSRLPPRPAAASVPPPAPEEAAPEAMALQLDVSINGSSARLIAAFTLDFAQRMASTRGELLELGIERARRGRARGRRLPRFHSGPRLRLRRGRPGDRYPARRRSSRHAGLWRQRRRIRLAGARHRLLHQLLALCQRQLGPPTTATSSTAGRWRSIRISTAVLERSTQSDVIGYTPDGDSAYTRLDTTYTVTVTVTY